MAFLAAGYAAFFLLVGGYLLRLVLLGRRLARERARLEAGGGEKRERDARSEDGPNG